MGFIPLTHLGKKNTRAARRPFFTFEKRLLFSILYAGLPGVVLGGFLLWSDSYSLDHKIEGTILLLAFWLGLSSSTRNFIVDSVRVLSNIVIFLPSPRRARTD